MKIIKQELEFEECQKQRLEFICEFSKVTPTMNSIKAQAEEIVFSELIYA